jgi:hypothetical protein
MGFLPESPVQIPDSQNLTCPLSGVHSKGHAQFCEVRFKHFGGGGRDRIDGEARDDLIYGGNGIDSGKISVLSSSNPRATGTTPAVAVGGLKVPFSKLSLSSANHGDGSGALFRPGDLAPQSQA